MNKLLLTFIGLVALSGYLVNAADYFDMGNFLGEYPKSKPQDGTTLSQMTGFSSKVRKLFYVESDLYVIDTFGSVASITHDSEGEHSETNVKDNVKDFDANAKCKNWITPGLKLFTNCISGQHEGYAETSGSDVQHPLTDVISIKCSPNACIAQTKNGRIYGAADVTAITCGATNFNEIPLVGYSVHFYQVGTYMSTFVNILGTNVQYCGQKESEGPISNLPSGLITLGSKLVYASHYEYLAVFIEEDGNFRFINIDCTGLTGCFNGVYAAIHGGYNPYFAITTRDHAVVFGRDGSNAFIAYAYGADNSYISFGTSGTGYAIIDGHVAIGAARSDINGQRMAMVTDDCGAGKLANEDTCEDCPEGHFCPSSAAAYPCPYNTWSSAGSSAMTDCSLPCPKEVCALGYTYCFESSYWDEVGGACVTCPAGFACDGVTATRCTGGKYQSSLSQTSCNDCVGGHVTTVNDIPALGGEGNTNCVACPLGYACTNGAKAICTGNKYADDLSLTECKTCLAGSYITEYEDDIGTPANKACGPCPQGAMCPNGETASPCISPQFQDETGQESCKTCNGGSFVSETTTFSSDTVGIKCESCPVGTECTGDGTKNACQNEFYQPEGGKEGCLTCDEGWYTDKEDGQEGFTLCLKCPIGTECFGDGTKKSCENEFYQPDEGEKECLTCDEGWYTDMEDGQEGFTLCLKCPIGTECPGDGQKLPCTGARYAEIEGQDECTPCDPGSYTNDGNTNYEGYSACHICPVGHECNGENLTPCQNAKYSGEEGLATCHICANGYFTNVTIPNEGNGRTACHECFAGTACFEGEKTVCTGDKYSNANRQALCDTCEPGYYIISTDRWIGNTDCSICPPGFKCSNGIDREECVGNQYTSSIMQTGCSTCSPGYFTESTNGQGNDKCTICPVGKSCDGTSTINTCTGKYYSGVTGLNECVECTAGKYTIEDIIGQGNTYCVDCPIGSSCNGQRTKCVNEFYQDVEGESTCKTCPPGSYTAEDVAGEGNTKCLECPIGYICDGNVQTPCTGAKYSGVVGLSTCDDCLAGKYTFSTDGTANDKCLDCPQGSECPGNGQSSKCTGRFYAPSTGLEECTSCAIGKYTSKTVGTNGNDLCINCPSGHGCNADDGQPVKCTGNTFANVGICDTCSPGHYTYETVVGMGNTQCQPCDQGYYCDGQKKTKCVGKYYSDTTGFPSCSECPAGKYTVVVNGASVGCENCPEGYYCDGETMRQCTGHYYSEGGASQCSVCENGKFITTNLAGDQAGCDDCPEGKYCDGEVASPCTGNKYTDVQNTVDCKVCLPGSYVFGDVEGNTDCLSCPPGKYCIDGIVATECAGNKFTSGLGALTCSVCPIGSYTTSSGEGNDACTPCTANEYCPDGVDKYTCPAGSYLLYNANNKPVGCEVCPIGAKCPDGISFEECTGSQYASTTGSVDCSDCDAGFRTVPYSLVPTRNNDCQACAKGMYCPNGKDELACTDDSFASTTGLNACETCIDGKYTIAGDNGNDACEFCPIGYSCNGITPTACSDFGFADVPGLATCKTCTEGKYLTFTESLQTGCQECPPGEKCNGKVRTVCTGATYAEGPAASECTECPAGRFIIFDEDMRVGCDECPPGKACDGEVATSCSGATYAEDAGMSECTPCPVGSFVTSNDDGNIACTKCTGNEYCDGEIKHICPAGKQTFAAAPEEGNSICSDCPMGHSCNGITATLCVGNQFANVTGLETCFTCPSGFYTGKNETDGSTSASGNVECAACPAGWFCENGQERSPCGDGTFTSGEGATSSDFCSAEFCPHLYTCVGGILIYEPNKPQGYTLWIILIVVGIIIVVGSLVAVVAVVASLVILKMKMSSAAKGAAATVAIASEGVGAASVSDATTI